MRWRGAWPPRKAPKGDRCVPSVRWSRVPPWNTGGRTSSAVRGLRPWGDDHALLLALNRGEFVIHGMRNRDLQKLLYAGEAESPRERRRRSAAIGRKLRMLRFHGLIKKVNQTHRYQVTDAGRTIIVAVLTTARTSLHQLNQLGKAA